MEYFSFEFFFFIDICCDFYIFKFIYEKNNLLWLIVLVLLVKVYGGYFCVFFGFFCKFKGFVLKGVVFKKDVRFVVLVFIFIVVKKEIIVNYFFDLINGMIVKMYI